MSFLLPPAPPTHPKINLGRKETEVCQPGESCIRCGWAPTLSLAMGKLFTGVGEMALPTLHLGKLVSPISAVKTQTSGLCC